jgi:DNA-binding response OmpR family regulator
MAQILAVDDDPDVLISVKNILEGAGHTVSTVSNAEEAMEAIGQQEFELVVLDIIMPGMDGIQLCRQIRADPHYGRIPVLFLTAKGRASDIVQGLDAGGDDYLTKPFEMIELPARVRAMLRRAPGGVFDPKSEELVVGALRLRKTHHDIQVEDRLVRLTSIEHRLLYYLMVHAGVPVSTDRLLEDVWGYPPGTGDPKLIHAHIGNLRGKIEAQRDNPQYILNVHGQGYMLST